MQGSEQIEKQNKLIFNYESIIRIVREQDFFRFTAFNSANFRIIILGLDFTHVKYTDPFVEGQAISRIINDPIITLHGLPNPTGIIICIILVKQRHLSNEQFTLELLSNITGNIPGGGEETDPKDRKVVVSSRRVSGQQRVVFPNCHPTQCCSSPLLQ